MTRSCSQRVDGPPVTMSIKVASGKRGRSAQPVYVEPKDRQDWPTVTEVRTVLCGGSRGYWELLGTCT